jgi:hypothetical protein
MLGEVRELDGAGEQAGWNGRAPRALERGQLSESRPYSELCYSKNNLIQRNIFGLAWRHYKTDMFGSICDVGFNYLICWKR